jgi:subtilisin family serine protease
MGHSSIKQLRLSTPLSRISKAICLTALLTTGHAATAAWTQVAVEGKTYPVSGVQKFRYGANGAWVEKTLTSGTLECTNTFFEGDPLRGVVKACELESAVPPPPPTGAWTKVAAEGQSYNLTGTQKVRYGAGSNWVENTLSGTVQCTNAFFERDPIVGVVKSCEVAGATVVDPVVSTGPATADTYSSKQWNLTDIKAPQAWAALAANTNKVRIATIDSENSVHNDVTWVRDAAGQPLVKPVTGYSHGTHVAGIIAAAKDNSMGVVGVCPQCEILPVIHGNASDEGFANSIKLAVRLDAQVINFSGELRAEGQTTSASCDQPQFAKTREAIAKAIEAGVTVVASAGNFGAKFDDLAPLAQQNVTNITPASCPGVISVGATDQFGKKASYTNVGATLMAPGGGVSATDGAFGAGLGCATQPLGLDKTTVATSTVGVLSTWRDDNNTNCYRYLSGTSMAAPHVSGVVGLMLAAQPRLTPAQIKGILQNSSNTTAITSCTDGSCGAGLLNAEKAVNAAVATPGAAVAYNGVCRFAFEEACKLDTYDELPSGDLSVTAYGKVWNFNAYGALIGKPALLSSLPLYTRPNGPCSASNRDANGQCNFNTRSVVDYPGVGYLDSITAWGKFWNFSLGGEPWGPEGGLLRSVDRYKNAPCLANAAELLQGKPCVFDTRTVVQSAAWGGLVESISLDDKYWNFDAAGNLFPGINGHGFLSSVTRYQAICALAPVGISGCKFDSRELKSNGNEVITAYGHYFEFSGENLIKSYNLKESSLCFGPEICNPYK